MTTKKVRWNGGKQDPDEIVQAGVTFHRGEWVDVDVDNPGFAKFEGNPTFEVQGEAKKPDPKAPELVPARTLKPETGKG